MLKNSTRHINPLASVVPKSDLRDLVDQLPETARIPMILGLDGDCDFARRITDFFLYECGREDLLALIEKDSSQNLPAVRGMSGFLVLCRRHAVCLTALLWSIRQEAV